MMKDPVKLREKKLQSRLESLMRIARTDSGRRTSVLRALARLCRRNGRVGQARRVLDHLLHQDPLDLQALLEMIRLQLDCGETRKALALCHSLQRGLPGMEILHSLEVRTLEMMGNRPRLIQGLQAYLGRFPERPRVRFRLATCLEACSRPAEALEQYESLLEGGYQLSRVHHRMAGIQYRTGNLKPALAHLLEAERLEPGRARVREGIARIHYAEGDYLAARDAALKLLEVTPGSEDAHRLMARSAFGAGDYERAADSYEFILERNPDATAERRELAEALYFSGDHRDAATEFRKVLKMEPKNGVAHFRLAEILHEAHFGDQAEWHYKAARELMPDALSPLQRLGDLALKSHKHREALTHFLRWMMLDPANPGVHLGLGKAYRMLREVSSARRHLQRAEELGIPDTDVFHERALLERSCGRSTLALAYLESALSITSNSRLRALLTHEVREIHRDRTRRRAEAEAEASRSRQVWKKLA